MQGLPSRKEIIQRVKDKGEHIAAVMPIFYPRELLRAYGFQPIEVWGPPNIIASEHQHFQSYACPIVRNATSFLLNGGLDQTDLIFVPHTCDSLQGMGAVLLDFIKPEQAVLTLYHPRSQRESDLVFLVAELKRLAEELSKLSGNQPSFDELTGAINREEMADKALKSLYDNRPQLALSDREFYQLVRSREYLPAEDFILQFEQLPKSEHQPEGVGICISGIVCEPMSLFDEINALGAHVAWDDLACGSRRLYQTDTEGDPFERMARRLLMTVPEPTKGNSITERVDYLYRQMARQNVHGVLVYDVKFCEPELFDIPHLKKGLSDQGIPLLHIEHELDGQLSEQMLTRIGAFVEMLQSEVTA